MILSEAIEFVKSAEYSLRRQRKLSLQHGSTSFVSLYHLSGMVQNLADFVLDLMDCIIASCSRSAKMFTQMI